MKHLRVVALSLLSGLLLTLLFFSSVTALDTPMDAPAVQDAASDTFTSHLPVLASTNVVSPALCRVGLGGAQRPLADYSAELLASLRNAWFINWVITSDYLQSLPNDMRYAPSIFVKQWKSDNGDYVLVDWDAPYADPYTYTIQPSLKKIAQYAAQYPGQLWLAGNEIERRDWSCGVNCSVGQQEILPEVYALAYHEIYHAIKVADPTARVANGSIILPSPLRLEYMTKMWDAYYELYGVPMPVDVWQIHLYLLQEKRGEWGADIPAGSEELTGLFTFDTFEEIVLVNKDYSKVPDLVRAVRVWMKERGQQNKPLIISEYGVNMPDWMILGEFDPEDVRDEYLIPSMNYFMGESDPTLGYPADDDRLVQSVWWWSLDADNGEYDGVTFYQDYNGNVLWSGLGAPTHSPNSMGLSTLGTYWVNYMSAVTDTVNLKPLRLEPQAPVFSNAGEPVTVSLGLLLANGGNTAVTQPFSVTLTDVDSSQELAAFTVMGPIEGCGGLYSTANVLWLDVAPGAHTVLVTVDGNHQIAETNEGDNTATFTVLVASYQIRLPVIVRR